mmetsp:Transcript_7099/g.18324  ORF Transcript_7099/g.18324 Transcript_7099/m.18324 type:complete len:92 (-) Transcript_7099:117-392(-)
MLPPSLLFHFPLPYPLPTRPPSRFLPAHSNYPYLFSLAFTPSLGGAQEGKDKWISGVVGTEEANHLKGARNGKEGCEVRGPKEEAQKKKKN